MRRLLVLRPEPGASATLERARELGLSPWSAPLFAIEPLRWKAPDPSQFDGLLLTSANAVRHAGSQLAGLRTLPAYAIGEATASAARDAGFEIAEVGDSGIDRLLRAVGSDLRLVHLCGEHRRNPENAPQDITSIPVYRAHPLRPDLAMAEDSVALVHSPRAAQRLAELVQARASVFIAAISPAAARAAGPGWAAVECAVEPNDDALLALAARLCNIPLQK